MVAPGGERRFIRVYTKFESLLSLSELACWTCFPRVLSIFWTRVKLHVHVHCSMCKHVKWKDQFYRTTYCTEAYGISVCQSVSHTRVLTVEWIWLVFKTVPIPILRCVMHHSTGHTRLLSACHCKYGYTSRSIFEIWCWGISWPLNID